MASLTNGKGHGTIRLPSYSRHKINPRVAMRPSYLLRFLAVLLVLFTATPVVGVAAPASAQGLNVQRFLDGQPGVLKTYRDGQYTVAQAIEAYASYYSLNPRILLTLLELEQRLLTDAKPSAERLSKPFGPSGPEGFIKQIEWAVREIRSGFGPYTTAPVVRFVDGGSVTLDVKQEASLLAVARFLAQGRTEARWRSLIDGYAPLYAKLWGKEPEPPTPTPAATRPFLGLPWPAGVEMIHSSYFDHVYPTVDRGADDNSFIVNYLGRGNLSYNTHDGHDYYFPQQPIGTPILAAAPGVAYAYSTPGNGVVIRHGGEYAGYETVYWHLDQFAIIFQGKIDNGVGVRVEAGTPLGVSGKSGFTDGGAHLHFEVRHNGKQVDPYGWYGPGPDPCAAWTAGCEASVWLWDESLSGMYDFTRPDAPAPADREPPVGSVAVSPDQHLGLLAHFDETTLPTIGKGFPQINVQGGGRARFTDAVFGKGVQLPRSTELSYPVEGNVEAERGTIAFWAKLPEEYPSSSTRRHYLFAASANPEDDKAYSDTLALRREQTDEGSTWNFWTVDADGASHNLMAPDTLDRASWHHFVVTWSQKGNHKALYIDGQLAARANDGKLPSSLGERLQVGRFIAGFGASGAGFDELAIFKRVLSEREIVRLAQRRDIYANADGAISTARVVSDRTILLDANAIDQQGGIVSVQLRRNDEPWSDPLSYYDDYRWTIAGAEGTHTFSIRYRDRANNETVVTTTVELQPALVGGAELRSYTDTAAVIAMSVGDVGDWASDSKERQTWLAENVELQLSNTPDFREAIWEQWSERRVWNWEAGQKRVVFVRFRDAQGRVSAAQQVGPDVTAP